MKFKTYILETMVKYGEGRTKTIDAETAVELIDKNCKKNFELMYSKPNSTRVYRGLKFKDHHGFVDTNTGISRKSANTLNYMTLLMDNLPSWKGWPKRSRGLVCATNPSNALSYGNVYNVIPYDNSLIGVCPSFDIWDSFVIALAHNDVSQFNRTLNALFDRDDIKVDDNNYDSLVKGLIELSKTSNPERQSKIATRIIHADDVMKHLNNILSPKKNNFKMGINNLSDDVEVWIQGKCILIDTIIISKEFGTGKRYEI